MNNKEIAIEQLAGIKLTHQVIVGRELAKYILSEIGDIPSPASNEQQYQWMLSFVKRANEIKGVYKH